MNKLFDAAETAASGRQQQWFVVSETKDDSGVGDNSNSDFIFGNERASVWNNYKNKKEKSIINMDINLDRRDVNKIESTHFLLGLSSASIRLILSIFHYVLLHPNRSHQ
jgi:hypothetical protein